MIEQVVVNGGTGVYRVTTASGTVYTINLDEGYSVRHGAVPLLGNAIVEDGERYYFWRLNNIEIGESLHQESGPPETDLWLWRRSTPITKIEEITNDIQST